MRRAALPLAVPLLAMAGLQVVIPRTLGSLDWLAIRENQLEWVSSISLRTYAVWTIRVVLESVFPLAPLLLAPLVGWRRAPDRSAVALLLIVPMRRARGEILTPLPDWQTWSLQDIGARALIAGDAPASSWSASVDAGRAGLGLVTSRRHRRCRGAVRPAPVAGRSKRARDCIGPVAIPMVAPRRGWSRCTSVMHRPRCSLLGATHVLWLYNDRYYLVFAPAVAIFGAAALDRDRARSGSPPAMLVVWAAVGITGTRDLLAFNEACAAAARRLEASGVAAVGDRRRVPVERLAPLRASGESAAGRRSPLRRAVCHLGPEGAVRDHESSAGRSQRRPGGAAATSDLASTRELYVVKRLRSSKFEV